MKSKSISISLCISTALCLVLMVFNAPVLPMEDLPALRGTPFSNPGHIQTMSPEWERQPITYGPDIGQAELVVSLNQQFFHFLEPLIKKYAKEHNLHIAINKGTCGITAGMLSRKEGDIGGFCCPPASTDRLPGILFHTIGIHPVSILVHPENPISGLTLDEVRKVFQGDIFRWSEVGWHENPIYVTGRLHCKKRPGHWRLLLDNEDLFSPELRTVGAIEDMYSMVSSNPDAIGYEVMWMTNEYKGKVKSLKINGHRPSELRHLLAGDYPFYRALYLTTWEGKNVKNPHAMPLVNYLIREVEQIGEDVGIIPADQLRRAGWKFKANEVIGEPQ